MPTVFVDMGEQCLSAKAPSVVISNLMISVGIKIQRAVTRPNPQPSKVRSALSEINFSCKPINVFRSELYFDKKSPQIK